MFFFKIFNEVIRIGYSILLHFSTQCKLKLIRCFLFFCLKKRKRSISHCKKNQLFKTLEFTFQAGRKHFSQCVLYLKVCSCGVLFILSFHIQSSQPEELRKLKIWFMFYAQVVSYLLVKLQGHLDRSNYNIKFKLFSPRFTAYFTSISFNPSIF